jgi:hypothetical protein
VTGHGFRGAGGASASRRACASSSGSGGVVVGPPVARFAAGLGDQAHLFDHHALVERLGHVIDCEERDRSGCHRFHFHAGLAGQRGGGGGADGVFLEGEIDRHRLEPERVAQRDQLAGALGGHDPGDARGGEHVALGRVALADRGERLRRHGDPAAGDRDGARGGLAADIDHAGEMDATVSYMRTLPRAHAPGTVWHYNTGETNLIGVLVSSATGKTLSAYLQEKVWQPAGMKAPATWLLGKSGHEIGGCCLQAATRDYARFGLFVLAGGKAQEGQQIVPEDWFARATTKQIDIGRAGRGYGFQWWTYDDGSFAAQGIFGQGIFIDPKRKLVIASNADWPRASAGPQPDERQAFYRQVMWIVDGGG